MLRLVLSTAVAGTLVAAAVPELQDFVRRAPSAKPAAADAVQAPRAAGARLGDVVIPADERGHFRIDGRIRGTTLAFLADTGATVVALRASDAGRLGYHPAPADYVVPVDTANGRVAGARITLDAIEVGSIRVASVDALVLPDRALGGNLIGMSFLRRLTRFEVSGGRLVLTP